MTIRRQVARAFIGAAFLCGAAQLCWGACSPPDAIAEKLRSTPDAALFADLGTWYADRKQFGCAAEVFEKAAALQPDSARYEYLLGLSLYSDQRSSEAVDPLRHALRIEPSFREAHMTLGAALDATGDRPAAEVQWRLALALNSGATLALDGLSRDLLADRNYGAVIALLRPVAATGAFSDDLAVDLSAAYSKSGLLQDAAEVLQSRLRVRPSSLPVAEALSGVLMLQSRFQDGVAVLAPIAKQNPAEMRIQVLYLQTLVLAHDAGAEALGERLLVAAPRNWELLYFMGILRQQADDYTGAQSFLRRSIAIKPDEADAHYRLGMVLVALKQNSAAKAELQKAIELGLDSPEVHVALAKALQASGDTAAAQRQFGLYAQRLQEQTARAQAADKAQQGDQAAAAGNPQQTVQDYREALALDPHEPVLAYKLAMALDKTGDHGGERAALNQAIAIDPHMALAQNQLGYLDAGDGNTSAAIQHFQLAAEADPGFLKAWLNLAASLCLDSRWTEAREAVHHVLELDAENANAKALLERMDAMQAQR